MKTVWEIWRDMIAYFFTAFLILIVIFGGEIHLHINWNSWSELINHFKTHK